MVNRGRILTIFLNPASLDFKKEVENLNRGKRGKPFVYPNLLVWAGLAVKCVFHQGYRQLQGFLEEICAALKLPIPNFRTFWWRIDKIRKQGVRFNVPNGSKIDVAVDSTGLKLINDGEYRTKKYRKIKAWAKFHTGVNEKTGEAVSVVITKDNVGDCREFKRVLKPVEMITGKVDTDKAYDTGDNFDYCNKRGILPGIPVKLNASPKGMGPRHDAVREQFDILKRKGRLPNQNMTREVKEANQKKWRKQIGHGYRWVVEGFYSRFKRLFGEYVFSRKRENVEKEVVMKANILNLFITS